MSLGLDANRLAIDRVYLNECTVKAYQERARLKNKREQFELVLNSINQSIAEYDEWLLTLEGFHRQHAKEILMRGGVITSPELYIS
jgi:prefoldin subunit 5